MKLTCHSEYLPLASVYIKTAADACIDDKKLKAEWETLNYLSCPELLESKIEYIAFETILKKEGVAIHYFPRDKHLSLDSMYCRDASIATNHGMIICTMGKEGRRLEPEAQQRTFQDNDITILGTIKAPGTLEGGDVAWLNEKTVAVGHTYRTNEEGIRQLKNFLIPMGVEVIVVDLPHYKGTEDVFHL
ncbi:MAG: hypothetical protein KAJ23_13580, partial [Maribacter sp.]|nr:hypothetical protein [Maribacter sp.]